MSLRRAAVLAVPIALAACTKVTQQPNPPDLVFARYSSPNVPTPNDLALAAIPAAPCAALPNAQAQLLCTFKNAGGFPSDQEVSISIPFVAYRWDPAAPPYGAYHEVAAPAIDLASVTASSLAVLEVSGTSVTPVTVEAAASAPGSCATTPCTPATLTVRKAADATGSRRWKPGARYVIGVRGGAAGVRTAPDGLPVQADSAIALVLPNKDLSVPENQPLGRVPDSNGNGTNADEVASLEALRAALWAPVSWGNGGGVWHPTPVDPAGTVTAFAAIDTVFPYGETAAAATFVAAPLPSPVVLIDAGSGQAPLPIDLLRTDADGTIATNPAFGPAAAGLSTLDGFSTTAMTLAQTTALAVDASSVPGNVFLFKLSGGTATLVRELKAELGAAQLGVPGANPAAAEYVANPTPIVVAQGAACPLPGGCSAIIGLQPAVTAPVPGVGTFHLPPLAPSTSYAVVITNRVKGLTATGLAALGRPTVAKILLEFTAPLAVGGKSAIPGVGDATAVALHKMRDELAPVWAALPTGTTKADVVTAYTFKTQGTTGTSVQLAAAPYLVEAGAGSAVFTTVAAPAAVTPPVGVPTTNVAGFYAVTFNAIDGIDKSSGAFRPTLATDLANPATVPTLLAPLTALVAIPNPSTVALPLCPGAPAGGPYCPKLVIFGHGLNGSKENMFATAASLASAGFVAAAIDFPLHGARNWCAADADCVVPGTGADGTCDKAGAFASSAGQGDAVRPGVCAAGSVPKTAGSRYFIGANFFRIRDAFRQNVMDTSALALALARPPAPLAPQPAVNPFASLLASANLAIDPSAVYYEGISLGAMAGTEVLAANPRVKRGVLSVGGGTLVDVFTNAPAFQVDVAKLFSTLLNGVLVATGHTDGGTPPKGVFTFSLISSANPACSATVRDNCFEAAVAAEYLKNVNVAKWILDPGDPINYAQAVRSHPLPDLLADPTGATPQAAKDVFAQIALGDLVVPNSYNELLDALLGGAVTTYSDDDPAGGPAPHSMLATSPTVQADAAAFLVDPAVVPPATKQAAF